MTPKHQQLIDEVLLLVAERAEVVRRVLEPDQGEEETQEDRAIQAEQLRGSVLGQRLRRLAEYVEGYPAAPPERAEKAPWSVGQEERLTGGIQAEVYQVCAIVYGTVHAGGTWSYPKHVQRTELGKLLHAALWQFYREHVPKELVSVAEASNKVGLARQTIHECMADGTVRWIYEAEHDRIWLDRDEVMRLRRRKMHRPQERRDDD
jgi:hypothetical protein